MSEGRWAHRRDPDLDALERGEEVPGGPEKDPPESARPPGASRYTWFVGVVGILVLAYIALNSLRTEGIDSSLREGSRMPAFAVPLVTSDLNGDANVSRADGEGAGKSGRTTACEVSDVRALNICDFFDQPVVLVFASVNDDGSVEVLDRVNAALARSATKTRVVGVFLRGDRAEARKLVRERGWDFPVGYDSQGDVGAIYGIKALPATIRARAGGRIAGTEYDVPSRGELRMRLREIAG